MQAFGRNQMLSSAVLQGVVSDEFASDEVRNRKWTCLINRPDDQIFAKQAQTLPQPERLSYGATWMTL